MVDFGLGMSAGPLALDSLRWHNRLRKRYTSLLGRAMGSDPEFPETVMNTIDDRMTAVVCYAPKDYRVEKIRRPVAGRNELVIRIAACGICASDCKCWSGAKMFWGANPWVKAPVVPGHEFFGYVEALGEGASAHFGVAPGDRVIAEQIVPCERCRYCKSGKYWMCEVHNI